MKLKLIGCDIALLNVIKIKTNHIGVIVLKLFCNQCGHEIYVYLSSLRNKRNLFCSIICKAMWQSLNCVGSNSYNYGPNPNLKGKNNPNYGNKWNDAQRERASEQIKKRYNDPEYRYNIGKSNRGKKLPPFSEEHKKKIGDSNKGRISSFETRKKIGKASKAKFTSKYKEKQRKIMEDNGYWVPIDDKDDYALYFSLCDWKERMIDYMNEKEITLLNTIGMKSRINSKGMVRDHKYARLFGYRNKVFPTILRHPANCQLITNAENIAKAHRENRYEDSNSIELTDLFKDIKAFSMNWHEQNQCLKDIKRYENGERINDKYIKRKYKKEVTCSSE